MPVHGEYRMQKVHAGLAVDCGVPKDNIFIMENGDVLALTKDSARRAGHFNAQDIYVDGNGIGDIGAAVQEHAEGNGYSVVREFGGHGVGLKFHEDPFVSHVGRRGTGVLLVPGMVFTIEPMINMGSRKIFIDADNDWTVLTDDGMPSAQWEYTVLITDTGAEIITG